MAIPQRLEPGKRLADDNLLNAVLATPQLQTNANITALAGGAFSASTPLLYGGSNEVTTVASSGDSVALANLPVGSMVFVVNAGANAMQVFASAGDTINGTAGATGISVANAKRILFVKADVGQWYSILTA